MDTKCVYLYQYKTAFCCTAVCAHGAWRRAKCWQTMCVLWGGRGDWGRSESDKCVVEHIRRYFHVVFLQEPYLLLTFAVRGQKS